MLTTSRAHLAFLTALLLLFTACADDPMGTPSDVVQDAGHTTHADSTLDEPVCPGGCQTPPEDTCIAPDRMRSFMPNGHCEPDGCAYTFADIICPDGCEAGRCVGRSCLDQHCDRPPPAYCDGSVLIEHAPEGACHDDACRYETQRTPCAFGCEEGACLDDPAPDCEQACDDPPATICASPEQVRQYASTGRCEAGACIYTYFDTACAQGCALGACTEAACDEVVCDTPPAPQCDGDTLLRHSSAGQCAGGECHYAPESMHCPFGCAEGACLPDPTPQCEGPCDRPPATICADADHVRSYSRAGQCEDGQCVYEATDTICPEGCAEGRCLDDPCLGQLCETPPAPSCQGSNLISYAPVGSCAQGVCQYERLQTACAYGCQESACAGPTGFLISEVYYDSPGADKDCFIEIHGPSHAPVEGLSLVAINGANGQVYARIPLSGQTTAAGFYVVMQPSAPEGWLAKAQFLDNRADLQNGPDSVQLRYGDEVLDALAYGRFGPGEHAAGLGEPAPAAQAGQSLSRDEDLSNTRDNATDFHISAPSPGERQAAATCEDQCTEEAVSCDGAQGTRRCVRQSSGPSAGCLAWSPDRVCGPRERCEVNACVPSCTDACTADALRCDGTQGTQRCVTQPSGCLGWSSTTLCALSERCEAGVCVESCTDACNLLATRCNDLWNTQQCVRQPSGCLGWSEATQCEHNHHCEAGQCVRSCTDNCVEDALRCEGERGVQTCSVQPSGCLDWSNTATCSPHEHCEAGQCVRNCTDNCVEDALRCEGERGGQTCSVQPSGCLDWSSTATCSPHEHCEAGQCVVPCSHSCPEGGQRCTGTQEKQLCEVQASGCRDWSAPVACAAIEHCEGGQCVVPCSHSCPEGGQRCTGAQEKQLCEVQASGCRDWSAPVACAAIEHCEGGACVLSCTDACEEGAQKCEGPRGVQTCEMQPTGCFDWSDSAPCAGSDTCFWDACRPTSGPEYPFDANACPGSEVIPPEDYPGIEQAIDLSRYRVLVEKRLCAAVQDCGPWEPTTGYLPRTFGAGDAYIMRRGQDEIYLVLRDDAYFGYLPSNPPPYINDRLGGHFIRFVGDQANSSLAYGLGSVIGGAYVKMNVQVLSGTTRFQSDMGKATGVVRPHCFRIESWAESRPNNTPFEEYRFGVVAHY